MVHSKLGTRSENADVVTSSTRGTDVLTNFESAGGPGSSDSPEGRKRKTMLRQLDSSFTFAGAAVFGPHANLSPEIAGLRVVVLGWLSSREWEHVRPSGQHLEGPERVEIRQSSLGVFCFFPRRGEKLEESENKTAGRETLIPRRLDVQTFPRVSWRSRLEATPAEPSQPRGGTGVG